MVVGSPGWSSGRKASGTWKVTSWRIVLNMTVTVPVALNSEPSAGSPIPPPALTLMLPAMPSGVITRSAVAEP